MPISSINLNGPFSVDPGSLQNANMYKAKGKSSGLPVLIITTNISDPSTPSIMVIFQDCSIQIQTYTQVQSNFEDFQLITGYVNIDLS